MLIECLQAGASGYLTKSCPLTDLIAAIRAVHLGELRIQKEMLRPLVDRLLNRWREQEEAMRRLSRLSRRAREALGLPPHRLGTRGISCSGIQAGSSFAE